MNQDQASAPGTGDSTASASTSIPADQVRIVEHIEQFFSYEHLPAHLQDVSRPFGELARTIIDTVPRNPERTVALRKLLESKDAAVRAVVAKERS